ncbi:MAG: hypothetical protein Kow00117_05000 [Phototrophicales bacterium]
MRMRYWMFALIVMLAACGGGEENTPQSDRPTEPTPIVRLADDVRVGYTPGSAENPIRMVMSPVDTIARRVPLLLEEAGAHMDAYALDASLRDDLGLSDDLNEIIPLLQRDFNVSTYSYHLQELQTVSDLIRHVQNGVGQQVADAVLDVTGRLHLELVFVEFPADALAALCDSDRGIISIAWLEAFTYAAALANRCGEPALLLARAENPRDDFANIPVVSPELTPEPEATSEVTPELTPEPSPMPTSTPMPLEPFDPGELRLTNPAVIVLNSDLGTSNVGAINGRTFCRLGLTDYYGWFIPSVFLDQNDLTPLEVVAYDDVETMFDAVVRGDCAAAGFSRDQLENLDIDAVTVAAEIEPLPYGILLYPLELDLGVRLDLTNTLPEIANDVVYGRLMRLLLGQEAFIPLEPDDLDDLDAYLASTGYDFSQLGR